MAGLTEPLPESMPGDAIPPPGERMERRPITTTIREETTTVLPSAAAPDASQPDIRPQPVVDNKKSENAAMGTAMLQIKNIIKFTYVILALLILSMLGNFVFYFLLRNAQLTREASVQALHHIEATREFTAKLLDQSRKMSVSRNFSASAIEIEADDAPVDLSSKKAEPELPGLLGKDEMQIKVIDLSDEE